MIDVSEISLIDQQGKMQLTLSVYLYQKRTKIILGEVLYMM